MTKSGDFAPRSVLVYVGLDRVGDSLLKMPFVRGLRQAFPDAKISWVAGKDTSVYATVMRPAAEGLLDEVIERAGIGLSPTELLFRPLKGRRFDLVIDTQRVALASFALMRIPCRRRISPFARFFFSHVKPEPGYRFPKTMMRQVLDLLELASGKSFPTPEKIDLDIPAAYQAEAVNLLPDGPVYVGIAPGAGGKPKCWPLDRFVAVAQKQIALGRKPVWLLGPAEQEWIAPLREATPDALFPLQTDGIKSRYGFSPLLTIALASRFKAALANDSGVGHMCAVGAAPLASLFGPTSPAKFAPVGTRLSIVRAQDFGASDMTAIPVEAAEAALNALLA